MNTAPHYLRARSLPEATGWLAQHPEARVLAGGQSLLPALRLGLGAASHLIDLQDLQPLHALVVRGDALFIGALCTHAQVARSALVQAQQPWLAQMAAHIADPQVREMGTIGGSLANADPAACWPAAVLAANAVVETTQRRLPADAFFKGLFSTALARDELIVGVHFPRVEQAAYQKFEQAASRFAQPGVAVVRHPDGLVRVAVTGLGQGVLRWAEAEQALSARFSQTALSNTVLSPKVAEDDVHASARYKTHLAQVLCRRIVAALAGEPYTRLGAGQPPAQASASAVAAPATSGLAGERTLQATALALWQLVLDPQVLQRCIPGCETIQRHSEERYDAVVQVGLGLVSARFHCTVALQPLQTPSAREGGRMRLVVSGDAGALGRGGAQATFALTPQADGGTLLQWQAEPVLEGKLAQIGQRFVFAVARQLSEEFLDRLQTVATGQPPPRAPWPTRLRQRLQHILSMLNPWRSP
ncbi:MAG: hypothetical protein RL559_1559 [Pseudomonadota bacterium]